MARKKRLVANISEKVMDEIWLIHSRERISRSQVVEKLLVKQIESQKLSKEVKQHG